MRMPQVNYGWIAIESAPFDKDVTLQVTDGRGEPYRLPKACSYIGRLGQLEQGNAACRYAGEVEALRARSTEAMTFRPHAGLSRSSDGPLMCWCNFASVYHRAHPIVIPTACKSTLAIGASMLHEM